MKYWRIIILLLIALTIGITTNGGITGLTDKYTVSDDVRTMLQVMDLPDSYIGDYTKLGIPTTYHLMQFYKVLTKFIDLVLATKLMSIFLYVLVALFSYLLAKELKLKYAFIFSLLITLQTGIMFWAFSGGLSRGFAFPLLLAFLYFAMKKNTLSYTFVMILQAIIYPPIFVISLGIIGIEFLRKNITIWKALPVILPAGLLYFVIQHSTKFGEQINLIEAIHMPEFYSGARAPVFRGDIPFTNSITGTLHSIFNSYNFNVSSPFYLDAFFLLGLFALLVLVVFWKKISLPNELKALAISSIILFVLSFIMFSRLYLPSRYIAFTFPIVAIYYISKGLELSLEKKSAFKKTITILFIILLAFAFYSPKIGNGLTTCDDKELYSYLEKLPKDSLIVAHPYTADCIPLYSGRNVLFMDELSPPYYKTYYTYIKFLIMDFFDMYYSNTNKVQQFCTHHHIDHIVIDERHFTQKYLEKGTFYREPFNSNIKIGDKFSILEVYATDIGNFRIIDCP